MSQQKLPPPQYKILADPSLQSTLITSIKYHQTQKIFHIIDCIRWYHQNSGKYQPPPHSIPQLKYIKQKGWYLIHWAVWAQYKKLIDYLIDESEQYLEQKTDQRFFFYGGQTPLNIAIIYRKYHTIQYLIRKGANIYATNKNNQNLVQLIARQISYKDSIRLTQIYQSLKNSKIKFKKYKAELERQMQKTKENVRKTEILCRNLVQVCQQILFIDAGNRLAYQYKDLMFEMLQSLDKQTKIYKNKTPEQRQNQRLLKNKMIKDFTRLKQIFEQGQKLILDDSLTSTSLKIVQIKNLIQNINNLKYLLLSFQQQQQEILTFRDWVQKQNKYFVQKLNNLQQNLKKRQEQINKFNEFLIKANGKMLQGLKYQRGNRYQSQTFLQKAKQFYQQAYKIANLPQKQQSNYRECKKILSHLQKEKVTKSQKEKHIHYICACLSQSVYERSKKQKDPKYKMNILGDTQIMSKVINLGFPVDELKSGYFIQADTIQIEGQKIMIISHCGTDPSENGDLAADSLLPFDLLHTQFSLAKKIVKQLVFFATNYTIIHTGHSLGAFLAQITASDFGHEAVTFQSPGTYDMLKKLKLLNKTKITTYLTAPNIINTIKPHAGIVYYLKMKTCEQALSKLKFSYDQSLQFKSFSYILPNQFVISKKALDPIKGLITERDIKIHSIDNFVRSFRQAYITRRQVQIWPIGVLQYISLLFHMQQCKIHDMDELFNHDMTKHLQNTKTLFYKLKDDSSPTPKL